MKRLSIIFTIIALSLSIQITGSAQTTTGPDNGSLLIMGGAADYDVFLPHFEKLAGGKDAQIIVVPTNLSDRSLNNEAGLDRFKEPFTEYGFQNVEILHTRSPEEANSSEFVEPLHAADGVWFIGGRQWRMAEAYLGTKTLEEIRGVLKRGGVIAGSSAGASIQGSFLVRGHDGDNTIMMGDHQRGFGLLTNTAIDQHLLARNRHFDMFEILREHDNLLGIGIDENTGIIVQDNRFKVVGESYVAIYDGTRWSAERDTVYQLKDGEEEFYFLEAGQRYNLSERRVITDDEEGEDE